MAAIEALANLGYKVNANELLVKLADDTPYQFAVNPLDKTFNQRHYEEVGGVMTQLICERLVNECGLVAQNVPLDAQEGEPTSAIFMSPGSLQSDKPLLLLVPGMSIQVGQWARKIVINENVYKGSMLEYVHRAQTLEGYNVLITNNNLNHVNDELIRGSESPQKHVQYVWENLVARAATNRVLVVAHSFGGVCMQSLVQRLDKREDESIEKLAAIALTDSVHGYGGMFGGASDYSNRGRRNQAFGRLCTNFVASDLKLGEEIGVDSDGVRLVSAGSEHHDQTTVVAIDHVFAFLKEKKE
ncbi:UNVERIFIED_CONTAM: hypothetical protein HDU68_010805 [Siphonaria sp. JEL0065]|nr:hypothetical protein HDU68_010805 [Siphonaria sp. JEL0065]